MEDFQGRIDRLNEEARPFYYLGNLLYVLGTFTSIYGLYEADYGNVKKAVAAGIGSLMLYANSSASRSICRRNEQQASTLEMTQHLAQLISGDEVSVDSESASGDVSNEEARQAELDKTWARMSNEEQQAFIDAAGSPN